MVKRQTLEKIEDEGMCWNGELTSARGGDRRFGTVWRGEGVWYEYESEDSELMSDGLSDEELMNVVEWRE